jgi:membrane AbrB-like protein
MKEASLLLMFGLAGAVAASWLGIPAGQFVGSMLAVAVFKLLTAHVGKAPPVYSDIGSILLGTAVGSTFNRPLLRQMGSLLLPTIIATLVLIVIGLVLGWLLSRLSGLDVASALFSLTPGGVAEMVAAARECGVDMAVVATLQLLRLVSVVMLAPAIITWLFS